MAAGTRENKRKNEKNYFGCRGASDDNGGNSLIIISMISQTEIQLSMVII